MRNNCHIVGARAGPRAGGVSRRKAGEGGVLQCDQGACACAVATTTRLVSRRYTTAELAQELNLKPSMKAPPVNPDDKISNA